MIVIKNFSMKIKRTIGIKWTLGTSYTSGLKYWFSGGNHYFLSKRIEQNQQRGVTSIANADDNQSMRRLWLTVYGWYTKRINTEVKLGMGTDPNPNQIPWSQNVPLHTSLPVILSNLVVQWHLVLPLMCLCYLEVMQVRLWCASDVMLKQYLMPPPK